MAALERRAGSAAVAAPGAMIPETIGLAAVAQWSGKVRVPVDSAMIPL
jgi:hypothetical protein